MDANEVVVPVEALVVLPPDDPPELKGVAVLEDVVEPLGLEKELEFLPGSDRLLTGVRVVDLSTKARTITVLKTCRCVDGHAIVIEWVKASRGGMLSLIGTATKDQVAIAQLSGNGATGVFNIIRGFDFPLDDFVTLVVSPEFLCINTTSRATSTASATTTRATRSSRSG